MIKLFSILILLTLSSCVESQNKSLDIKSFEDFMQSMEDPSVQKQNESIKNNNIKKCSIVRWEHSTNNDTLEIQSDSTNIYYNRFGAIDSSILHGYRSKRKLNFYNSVQQLQKCIVISRSTKFADGVRKPVIDTTTIRFTYDKNLLLQEIIESSDKGEIVIDYEWNKNQLKKIVMLNNVGSSAINYEFKYRNGILIERKLSTANDDPIQNKTNEFIYQADNLMEITNTWIMANNNTSKTTKFNSPEEEEEFRNVTNTKFNYFDSGRIKSLQKVYGMWPGESFWITSFNYFDNGLIKEKELDNDGEFGHTRIIHKYKYK